MRAHLILLTLLALAACSAEPDPPAAPQTEQTTSAVASESAAPSREGSPILLAPLTPADREAYPLEGELGCAFDSEEGALFIAFGDVGDEERRAQALVKVAGQPERLTARETGGYDGLPDGGVFAGPVMTITVARTSETPLAEGESPPYPAKLLLEREGSAQTIPGRWTCGP